MVNRGLLIGAAGRHFDRSGGLPIKGDTASADAGVMGALLSPEFVWLAVLIVASWTVLMSLRAIGAEVQYREAVHRLKIEAKDLQISYARRMRQHLREVHERARAAAERKAARDAANAMMNAESARDANVDVEQGQQDDVAGSVAHPPARAAA